MKVIIGSVYVQSTARTSALSVATPDPVLFASVWIREGSCQPLGVTSHAHTSWPCYLNLFKGLGCATVGPAGAEVGVGVVFGPDAAPLKFSGLQVPQGLWKVSW